MSKTMKILLCAVMAAAVALSVLLLGNYQSAHREYSALKNDFDASDSAWRRINEEKLVIQKDLKAVKEEIREAEMTLEEYEELKSEVEALEKEVEALKSAAASAE